MTLLSARREVGEFKKRYKWMGLAVTAVFTVLFCRLIYLQLITHNHWTAEAQNNITKRIRLPATRGVIRDSKGRDLAINRAAYSVYITPQLFNESRVERMAWLMGLDQKQSAELKARIAAISDYRRTHFVKLFSDISREQLAALETYRRELPGLEIIAAPVRMYPFKYLGAHAIGFLNEVNADDLKRLEGQGYQAGQMIGRSGIEKAWESYLRGRDGELAVAVDVRGREYRAPGVVTSSRREPIPGRDLELTLDMNAMHIIDRAFAEYPSGAAVLVEAHTGRVRAMYSKPGYDLNEMSGRLSPGREKEIEQSMYRPLIDKSCYESYSPGSVFKPFSVLAALEDHILDPTTIFDCPGYYELGRRRFRCSEPHHKVDLRKAIVVSCNVYFYHLAEQVGLDRLARVAQEFGLGAKTGVGLDETAGFSPTREWYVKRYQEKFRVGFTLNEAIGQGNARVTLIQLALAYAAIANGGTLYIPQLVQAIKAPSGETIETFEPRVRRRIAVDRKNLAFLVDALFGVVNDQGGTAFDAHFENSVPVAGKTGTAQVTLGKSLIDVKDPHQAWYYSRSHAWFVGFAPAQEPELALAVLVEHGGPGGKYAAPIAIQIFNDLLKKPAE